MSDSTLTEINSIKEQLHLVRYLPPGPIYQDLNKYLAKLYLEIGEEQEAIYHLVETHGVSLRLRTVSRINKQARNETHLNKDLVEFGGELQQDGINGVRKRLAEFPKEWTVVQLTSGFNPLRRFGDPNQIQQPTTLHITRLESEPYCVTVNLPASAGLLEELSNIIAHHKAHLQEFIHYPTKYWKAREEKNLRMNAVVRQLENAWMKEWRCLLAGKLVNDELTRKVESAVKERLLKTSQDKSVEDSTAGGDQVNYRRASRLLFQAVLAAAKLTVFEVKKIVASCMGVNIKSDECNILAEEIININKSITELETAKRHPLIIILDDQLEQFPWEMISLLSGHPVVRAHSLHMLHSLFKVHEKDIKNGHVVSTNPELGNYIVNPDQNLNSMEERIKMSLVPRTPKWKGIFGVKPTSQQFKNALKDYDIFFYSGHGCGTKYLLGEDIQKIQVQAASLLFGCDSIGLMSLGRLVENWGTAQSYLIGCSPCIVGTLWTVTDQDTDRLALNMLHHWLPPTEEMKKRMSLVEPKDKRPLRNEPSNLEFDLIKKTSSSWQQEPELLRALFLGRQEARQFMTSAAFAAIGLPIKLHSEFD